MKAGGCGDQIWEQMGREADFSPAKMASLCSISERHLQRIFRSQFQCTPGRWLRELRCRLARELIAHGYSTKAAAAEVKFRTEAHFCREFKRVYGSSPQSFAPAETALLRLVKLNRESASDPAPTADHPVFP